MTLYEPSTPVMPRQELPAQLSMPRAGGEGAGTSAAATASSSPEWRKVEDRLLRRAVAMFGGSHWSAIANMLSNTSPRPSSVQGEGAGERKDHAADAGGRDRQLQQQQAAALAEAARPAGGAHYRRSSVECRERWEHVLKPQMISPVKSARSTANSNSMYAYVPPRIAPVPTPMAPPASSSCFAAAAAAAAPRSSRVSAPIPRGVVRRWGQTRDRGMTVQGGLSAPTPMAPPDEALFSAAALRRALEEARSHVFAREAANLETGENGQPLRQASADLSTGTTGWL